MPTVERRSLTDIKLSEWGSSVIAGIAGSVNSVVITHLFGGSLTPASWWKIHFAYTVLLSLIFPVVVCRYTNLLSRLIIMGSSTSRLFSSNIASLIKTYGLASATTVLGISFGLVLWGVFGVFGMPIWFSRAGVDVSPVAGD
ncbi:MAG: hypothetical protein SV760_08745, partial [Halobacteria archaeon]|nr:hypothetical protein [Halobacteria archaeon]